MKIPSNHLFLAYPVKQDGFLTFHKPLCYNSIKIMGESTVNITKRDIQELRKRFTRKSATIGQLCGCYVNGSKNILLKFESFLPDLEEDEFYKYLEIAKKVFSGTLGNNLLELEFLHNETGTEHQQYLLALKSSKLKNEDLLARLYEKIIENYECEGNYLILVFHDIYDVMTRTRDHAKLDESEEIYEYCICAICPVTLSKAALGYREDENRIGARIRDWVVGMPDLGFVYPAFSDRSSDVNAVLYYLRNPSGSHPEMIESVLGCELQRTADEEKNAFASIVKNAFGEQEEDADRAFLKIQRTLNGIAAECEQDGLPPALATVQTVADIIQEADIPEEIQQNIEKSYTQEFGEMLPQVQNLVDAKLASAGAQRARVAELEQEVITLKQQLSDAPAAPEGAGQGITMQLPKEAAAGAHIETINGQKCFVIPLAGCDSASINGTDFPLA